MLCSADFGTVLAVGRPRWTLKAKLRVRSEYGGSAGGLILLKTRLCYRMRLFLCGVNYERVLHFQG